MDKNENYTIEPVMNGFKIEHHYRYRSPTEHSPDNYEYAGDEYFFSTWDQILTWITNNPMDFPPTKI